MNTPSSWSFRFWLVTIGVLSTLAVVPVSAQSEDTQLIDKENSSSVSGEDVASSFSMQRFESCEDMQERLYDLYSHVSSDSYYGGDYAVDDMMAEGMSAPTKAVDPWVSAVSDSDVPEVHNEYSITNVQVLGVDESERVKTDGRYIYYSNNADRRIYIADASDPNAVSVRKSIKIPDSFANPELFLTNDRLVILSTRYAPSQASDGVRYSRYWSDRSVRTAAIVYDTSDIDNLKLERYELLDGSFERSRMIGDTLYVVSSTYVHMPYSWQQGGKNSEFSTFDQAFDAADILPRYAELRSVSSAADGNVTVRGRKIAYRLSSGASVDCSDVAYILPNDESVSQFGFNPRFVTLSAIDTSDASKEIATDVVLGDLNEVYMSLDHLYLTSRIYDSEPALFRCPVDAFCLMPQWGISNTNTLVHKFSVNGRNLAYDRTAFVPGEPLNQYSMDQSASGSFRIVTSNRSPKQSTSVYVLDKNFKKIGSLERLAEGEEFKSSRYIGDKLFLVTFQSIDPLFVIDISNETAPEVIGELKMPGYSTYLHSYDENHLMGIGYDTEMTEWGGTRNGGIQVALYRIDYDERETAESRCWTLRETDPARYDECLDGVDSSRIRVSQVAAKTFGQQGSFSETLIDPRTFMWIASRKTLVLPVLLHYHSDPSRPYDISDAFQGSLVLGIDPETGINERREITHMDLSAIASQREKACMTYISSTSSEPQCKKLIGGGEYCLPVTQTWVPSYCYADSTPESYMAYNSWEYQRSFVARSVYIGSYLFVMSDDKVTVHNMDGSYNQMASVDWER